MQFYIARQILIYLPAGQTWKTPFVFQKRGIVHCIRTSMSLSVLVAVTDGSAAGAEPTGTAVGTNNVVRGV